MTVDATQMLFGLIGFLLGLVAAAGVAMIRRAHLHREMSAHFESLSARVARDSQQGFLTLAEESFKRLQAAAKAEQDKAEAAVKGLVEPVHKNLEHLQKYVGEMEKQRHGAFAELTQNIALIRGDHEKLRAATATLAQALRAPGARGRWGEIHLQRALEAVGMTQMVDFIPQDTLRGEDGWQRPDVVIHLPGGRSIVIDAKVPLDGFLDATQDGIDDAARAQALGRHAEQVKKHIRALSSRGYWEKLNSPEFVLMYLPGDAYYAAALESDPSLFEAGIAHRVFLMTPSTLLPTLRVIEHAWKQEKMAQSAKDVAAAGQDLYKRLVAFAGHFDKMRKGLAAAVGSYDDAVGSLERSVLPSARRLRDMQGGPADTLAAMEPLGRRPRALNAPEAENDAEEGNTA